MLSSMASQTSVAPPAPAVDMAVDRQVPEVGGEKRGHEDRGRDAVMGVADDLQGQASSSSQQEQSESSKVRRIMGLETWTAEQEPGADEDEQLGAEEVALERKKQFEAVCPLLLEVGEVLAAPTLEDLTPAKPVYATKSGAELDPQAVAAGRRKQLRALQEQKAIILVPHDFPPAGAKRISSEWRDDNTTSGTEVILRLVATEVAYGNRDDSVAGYFAAEGSTIGGQLQDRGVVHTIPDEVSNGQA